MTRQERSSDILDDIQAKMDLNSQGKNIYLQLHPHFHLTAAAAPPSEVKYCLSVVALADWCYKLNANRAVTYGNRFHECFPALFCTYKKSDYCVKN